jgi:hypothetical protein
MGGDGGEDGGRAGGQAVEDGADVLVHTNSWHRYGSTFATVAIPYTSSSNYSCEYECFSLYVPT